MRLDILKTLESVCPWEFIVTYDGKDYPTRRPTVGMIAQLQNFGTESMQTVIQTIFVEPGPDLSQWPADAIYSAGLGYLGWFNSESGKNYPGPRIRDQGCDSEHGPKRSMIAEWALSILTVCPAMHPNEVFEMDAIYSILLCGAWIARRTPPEKVGVDTPETNDGWRDMGDGRQARKVKSMDDLYGIFGGKI